MIDFNKDYNTIPLTRVYIMIDRYDKKKTVKMKSFQSNEKKT